MKGYAAQRVARRRERTERAAQRGLRRLLTVGAGAMALTVLTSCGLMEDAKAHKPIEVPDTVELQTETPAESLPPESSTTRRSVSTAPTIAAADSVARAIRDANRVSTTEFHVGADTENGSRQENVSGVHFSTPDRGVHCSVGHDDSGALVCASDEVQGPERAPASAPAGCDWDEDLLVLDEAQLSRGACQNQYSVMYRSTILEFGSALTVNRYSCLSDVDGLYCLEAGTDRAFRSAATDSRRFTVMIVHRMPRRLPIPIPSPPPRRAHPEHPRADSFVD